MAGAADAQGGERLPWPDRLLPQVRASVQPAGSTADRADQERREVRVGRGATARLRAAEAAPAVGASAGSPRCQAAVHPQHGRVRLRHSSSAEPAAAGRQDEAGGVLLEEDERRREELRHHGQRAAGHRRGCAALAVLPGRQPAPHQGADRPPGPAVAQQQSRAVGATGEVGGDAVRPRVRAVVCPREAERSRRRAVAQGRPRRGASAGRSQYPLLHQSVEVSVSGVSSRGRRQRPAVSRPVEV